MTINEEATVMTTEFIGKRFILTQLRGRGNV